MTAPVYIVAKVMAKAGDEKDLAQALLGLVAVAKTEPGFVQYDLHVSEDNPAEFVFYEIWASEELLDIHNNTDPMKAFGAKAGAWIEGVDIKKYKKIS